MAKVTQPTVAGKLIFASLRLISKPMAFGDEGVKFTYDFLTKWDKAAETAFKTDPLQNPIRATIVNMKMAQLGRPCIVARMYYRDVGHIAAPGGLGKTTLLLWHAIQIAFGGTIFGHEVVLSGPVVYITAEDDAESIFARLWKLCEGMPQDDLEMVDRNLHIIDATGHSVKLTTVEKGGSVVPSARVDTLIATLKMIDPLMVFIDPTVSFGVGESRVNDAEQGLIEVGRRIVKQVGCGVIYVHHTGKTGVRDGEAKQYSGRGGSALADGSRMVFTLENLTAERWLNDTGDILEKGESALLFSSPKLTWCPPQPPIYLKRTGFAFDEYPYVGGTEGVQAQADNNADKIHRYLKAELREGRHHTGNSLRDIGIVTPQTALRLAIHNMIQEGLIERRKEEGGGRGGAREWLCPIDL